MKLKPILAWQQYEAGKDYKRRIGLYETVRRNERFYRGDQWKGNYSDLPHPVFNLVKRITDYLVASVAPGSISIHYTDDRLPFLEERADREKVAKGIALLNENANYRWKQSQMDSLSHKALLDAALSGDGVFYCWWDGDVKDGQFFHGDIRTELLDNTNLFVADVNKADLQNQEYVILSGRCSVASLRREAEENGVNKEDVKKIRGDGETSVQSGDYAAFELDDEDEKATYLIKFFRENGKVICEKSVENCVIKRTNTGLSLYPIASFSWQPTKNSFHGTSPVSSIIPNQRYVNAAYAMAMKHMNDTAFSKVIYDKSRIPEWSNEVGEAIAVLGGGNVSDAVTVLGTGKMQDRYLELINAVIENTKSMMGATESALGDEKANNTSAILTLQEASKISLHQVEADFRKCLGELAAIWADMLCTYCPKERLLAVLAQDGTVSTGKPDYALLKNELLRATVEVQNSSEYTPAAEVNLLNKLLDGGYLKVEDYVKLLPENCISNREGILNAVCKKENASNE